MKSQAKLALEAIYLYDDPDAAGLDVDYLAEWLAERFPRTPVQARRDFVTHHLGRLSDPERTAQTDRLQHDLGEAEVTNLVNPADRDRLPAESPADRGWDVVYEGTALQAALAALLPAEEAGAGAVHIVFTVSYLGQWPADGSLLRLRVLVPGRPHLLSISSFIEGLDLPRQYHFMRQQMVMFGMTDALDDLAEQFGDQALGYGDQRLNEVLKGLVLQAIFQQLTGELGCRSPRCRLHVPNSHAQALRTQARDHPGLCDRHAAILRSWGGVPE